MDRHRSSFTPACEPARRQQSLHPAHPGFEFENPVPITRLGRIAIVIALIALILQCAVAAFGQSNFRAVISGRAPHVRPVFCGSGGMNQSPSASISTQPDSRGL